MYRTLSSVNDHQYIPSRRGPDCKSRNPNITCNTMGCVRCRPSCEICGLYHPPITYSNSKGLKFQYSRDTVFSQDYQHFLYHGFEPDNTPPKGHPPEAGAGSKRIQYCYDPDCTLCRPACKHCGKLERNHSYR